MKPRAKKGLIAIAVLYAITVGVTIINFVYESRLENPGRATRLIQQYLNRGRQELHELEPEKIRSTDFSEPEARNLLDVFRRQGSIINVNFTLIMQCLNFAIVLLILYGLAWDPLIQFLDERRRRVKDKLQDAADRQDEASKLVQQRREELADLKEERTGILEQARQTAEQQRDQIIERARREADRITRATEERLREEFRRARTSLREEVADLVTQVAARLLQRELDSEDHRRYIDEMIDQMAQDSAEGAAEE